MIKSLNGLEEMVQLWRLGYAPRPNKRNLIDPTPEAKRQEGHQCGEVRLLPLHASRPVIARTSATSHTRLSDKQTTTAYTALPQTSSVKPVFPSKTNVASPVCAHGGC